MGSGLQVEVPSTVWIFPSLKKRIFKVEGQPERKVSLGREEEPMGGE